MNDNEPFLPYAKQSIASEDLLEVGKTLASNVITRGPYVEAFEQELAKTCGAKYVVVFHSGTAALSAAYHAGGLSSFDRVITTPNTFIATVGPAIQEEATHVFIDIDSQTGNLDLEQLKYNLETTSSRGKTFIVPVHFAGVAVDMKKLDLLIKDPKTVVIEDAAHALGSFYPSGEKVGSCPYSQMTIFSFHPAKTITSGEGGAVSTNDPILYHLLKRYRNNGIERDEALWTEVDENGGYEGYYEVQEISNNYNVTEMQGALGLSQLKRLDLFVEKRRALMKAYRQELQGIPHLRMFTEEYDDHTAFHLCVVQLDFKQLKISRKNFIKELKSKGIGAQVHYIPLYRHPVFVRLSGQIEEYFPRMEKYYEEALTLPLYYDMTMEDVKRVVKTVSGLLNKIPN
jgi:UDP-4-amino-4,6-dideoxy-L-N-acetyl-beta-L-altrosamine transaminase